MKAVIWTDVFQIFVMLSGFMAIFIQGTILVGGPARVLKIVNNGSRLNFDEYAFLSNDLPSKKSNPNVTLMGAQ